MNFTYHNVPEHFSWAWIGEKIQAHGHKACILTLHSTFEHSDDGVHMQYLVEVAGLGYSFVETKDTTIHGV